MNPQQQQPLDQQQRQHVPRDKHNPQAQHNQTKYRETLKAVLEKEVVDRSTADPTWTPIDISRIEAQIHAECADTDDYRQRIRQLHNNLKMRPGQQQQPQQPPQYYQQQQRPNLQQFINGLPADQQEYLRNCSPDVRQQRANEMFHQQQQYMQAQQQQQRQQAPPQYIQQQQQPQQRLPQGQQQQYYAQAHMQQQGGARYTVQSPQQQQRPMYQGQVQQPQQLAQQQQVIRQHVPVQGDAPQTHQPTQAQVQQHQQQQQQQVNHDDEIFMKAKAAEWAQHLNVLKRIEQREKARNKQTNRLATVITLIEKSASGEPVNVLAKKVVERIDEWVRGIVTKEEAIFSQFLTVLQKAVHNGETGDYCNVFKDVEQVKIDRKTFRYGDLTDEIKAIYAAESLTKVESATGTTFDVECSDGSTILMSAKLKTELDGLADQATVTVEPPISKYAKKIGMELKIQTRLRMPSLFIDVPVDYPTTLLGALDVGVDGLDDECVNDGGDDVVRSAARMLTARLSDARRYTIGEIVRCWQTVVGGL